jgi:hypothetical protein
VATFPRVTSKEAEAGEAVLWGQFFSQERIGLDLIHSLFLCFFDQLHSAFIWFLSLNLRSF